MISGIELGEVDAIIRYHSDTMTYAYSKDGKPIGLTPSEWYGKGAELAGVFGKSFEEKVFRELLMGHVCGQVIAAGQRIEYELDPKTKKPVKDPATGKPKVLSKEWVHVPAYDYTFAPGRTVSYLALVAGDERVIAAHNAAVKKTIDYMEQNAVRMRVYADGERGYVAGDNLLVGMARHYMNRESEPHLHTHCVILNMTYDAAADKWRALDIRKMEELRVKQELDRIYQGFLGDALELLGYKVTRNA